MLNALIGFSLKNRFVILLVAGILVALGVRAAIKLPLDAFPDTTPVQIQINTVAPELAPEEIERQITFPVEQALGGSRGSRRSAPSPNSGCRRWSRSLATTPTSISPGSRSANGWARPGSRKGSRSR